MPLALPVNGGLLCGHPPFVTPPFLGLGYFGRTTFTVTLGLEHVFEGVHVVSFPFNVCSGVARRPAGVTWAPTDRTSSKE